MLTRVAQIVVSVIALLIFVVSIWTNWNTSKANSHVDEANAASTSANALVTEILPKYKELYSEANLNGFPGNRDQFKADAQMVSESFAKAADQYRLAASKLDEASQQAVDKPLKDSWGFRSQAYRKLADSKAAFGQLTGLLLDESIADIDALNAKIDPIVDQATKASDEFHKLEAEANKIQEAHKDKFK